MARRVASTEEWTRRVAGSIDALTQQAREHLLAGRRREDVALALAQRMREWITSGRATVDGVASHAAWLIVRRAWEESWWEAEPSADDWPTPAAPGGEA